MPPAPLPSGVIEQIVGLLDVRMMREIPVWMALSKSSPETDEDKEMVWVCDGGTVPCGVLPIELLEDAEALARSAKERKSLRRVAKGLRKSWKGTKGALLKRERSRTGIKDLGIGMMFTKKGVRLVYAIHDPKHPGPGHPHPHTTTTPGGVPASTPRRTSGGRGKVTGRRTVA